MRILVVSDNAPTPTTDGGRLRLRGLLRELQSQASVTLLAPRDVCDPELQAIRWLDSTSTHIARVTPSAVHQPPMLARLYETPSALAAAVEHCSRADTCDATLLFGARAGVYAPYAAGPTVWDVVDDTVLHTLIELRNHPGRFWRLGRQLLRCMTYEAWVGRSIDRAVATTRPDAKHAQHWTKRPSDPISNGVDLDFFQPCQTAGQSGVAVFIGDFGYRPNEDGVVRFTQRIWPHVRRAGAAQRLLLVGRRPTPRVRALAANDVEVHADVPDVRPFAERAAVVIAPLPTGGGVRNKVLEACAMQRPVIATRRVVKHLDGLRWGDDVLVADTPQEWVAAFQRVGPEPARRTLAENGRLWVQQGHTWREAARQLLASLQHAVAEPAPASYMERVNGATA